MKDYIHSFYSDDPKTQKGILLKEEHTGHVVAICRDLAEHLHLCPHDITLAQMLGLFHDIGRFSQFARYHTFRDAESVNHAVLGLQTIDGLPLIQQLSPQDQGILRFSIYNHNTQCITPTKNKRQESFAKLLRDADKVDIYRVLSPMTAPADSSECNSALVEKFIQGEQCNYDNLHTINDYKLVRLLWVYDLNYARSLEKIEQQGYIERLIAYMPQTPALQKGYGRLRAYTAKRLREPDEWACES